MYENRIFKRDAFNEVTRETRATARKTCNLLGLIMDTKSILEKHKETKLPSFPNDDDFAEWVEELIDMDGYYYGLATSILGGDIKPYDVQLFQDLKHRLYNFKNLDDDEDIYIECEKYLNSLETIVKLIQEKSPI